ncbi:hypothetical protein ABFY60_00970 [Lysinibacillus pakistanensis]|uniref:hypothetical protein n=1 Tax=Lysinibacillus pakistanensis TaxID=759811 RepID=UPI003D29B6B6
MEMISLRFSIHRKGSADDDSLYKWSCFNSETRSFENTDFEVHGQYFTQLNTAETEIDLHGYYITPGLIDSCSQIGLAEIGIRWRAMTALSLNHIYNTQLLMASIPLIQRLKNALSHGITASHIVPSPKSLVGAKTAIIHHTPSIVDEMVIKKISAIPSQSVKMPKVHFLLRRKNHLHVWVLPKL